jgi:ubiquinone/menaquinone biosynthesis C-methylase UbiE
MDHSGVNDVFVADFLEVCPSAALAEGERILDLGTGTALIPIEFCRQSATGHILGVDLAEEMLKAARRNVDRAGFADRITLEKCDAKGLPFAEHSFPAVMSNSIIHHIPEPLDCFREMVRVLQPGGLLFVRDLMRPESEEELEATVKRQASEETEYSQQLFRQSLHAALTVEEIRETIGQVGLPRDCVQATSDRHWTISFQFP